jgi:hypothetical protein
MNIKVQITEAANKAVLKFVSDGGWLQPNYESRVKVPAAWIEECWGMVDKKKVQQQLAARIETELADRLVNHIAAEMATDIKQILGIKERREAIRTLARNHIESIMSLGKEEAMGLFSEPRCR